MPRFIEGISVGETGASRALVVGELQKAYGVTISPASVPQWRVKKRPIVTEDRVRSSKRLSRNDALYKDSVYLSIARAGIRLRKVKKTSNGFTEDLSKEVDINDQTVRNAIRSMRAEIVFDPSQLNEDHKEIFIRIAGAYLDYYLHPNVAKNIANYERLDFEWDRTIPHFYQLLYGIDKARVIGSWTPYEVEFIGYFYTGRISKGSRLSVLDNVVLASYRDGANLTDLAQNVRSKTNIKVSATCLAEHRNFLLRGKPHNPDLLAISLKENPKIKQVKS